MDIEKLIEKLRTESLYKDKATIEIMDLCMEAADKLERINDFDKSQSAKLLAENGKLRAELDVMREITEVPAADVAPVKHGKWGAYEVFPLTASLNGHPCSECGMRFSTSQIVFMNYCPNCGARMEQEEEA